MRIEFTSSTRGTRALLCVTAVAALATGCSNTTDDPTPKQKTSTKGATVAAVARASTAFGWALHDFVSNGGDRYPETATLDTEANTLILEVADGDSTTVVDAEAFTAGVKLDWYRTYADPRVAKAGTSDGGFGYVSFCLSGENNHKVTSGSPLLMSDEVGKGSCPTAPTKP